MRFGEEIGTVNKSVLLLTMRIGGGYIRYNVMMAGLLGTAIYFPSIHSTFQSKRGYFM
jgi:hypothetical protein